MAQPAGLSKSVGSYNTIWNILAVAMASRILHTHAHAN